MRPQSSFNIRQATPADIDDLIPCYADFFREDGITVDPQNIRKNLILMLQDPRAAIFVAQVNGSIAGLASVSTTYGVEFGCAAEFEDLYVAPEHRRKGLSRLLVQSVLDWADTQDAGVVALVITAQAERDQGLSTFYETLGFTRSDRLTMYRIRH